LEIFNLIGEKLVTLVDAVQPAGHRSIVFDARNLPNGMYFYRLTAGSFVSMKKMTLMK
jgi:hypothetical protein